MDITQRAKKIKLLLLDVDGVLTDGRLVLGSRDDIKHFHVHDGFGVYLLKKAGIKCAIITAKDSAAVRRRSKAMGVDRLYAGRHYKIEALSDIIKSFRVREEEICFVGDDLIDLPIQKRVGLAVAVPGSVDDVKKSAHYKTVKEGGAGAVREVCEMLLKAQGKWESVTEVYRV